MRPALFAACCVLLSACKTVEPAAPADPQPSASSQAEARPMPPGLDALALDERVDPCEDFYAYACGGWMQATEIPPDRARWSRGFDTIEARNKEVLRSILEEAAAGRLPPETPYAQALGDFYGACMDEPQLEQALPVLKAELASLAGMKKPADLAAALGRMHSQRLFPFFFLRASEDQKDVTQVIGELDQGGLTLPDRDYYLKGDEKMQALRQAFVAHMAEVFTLLGDTPEVAQKKAAKVLELETALARASLSRVERRDPEKVYHRMSRKEVEALVQSLPLGGYLQVAGAGDVQVFNVTHPPFFQEVDRLVQATPLADWGVYLSWHMTTAVIQALPKRFREAEFRFVSQHLTGAKEEEPRWKLCVEMADGALGHALARPFIARTFGVEGKDMTQRMVVELEKAFEHNLQSLAWMDEPTREQARAKVRTIMNKIGYPDRWREYEGLKVERGSFLRSLVAAESFEHARQMGRIGKPVDRGEWLMTPPTVNAYYNPLYNEIVFPAGILQPPFFDRKATLPVNLGAMGMVVGHEITHGFDDEGRMFDAQGNLRTWWTEGSDKAFRERVACVEQQYSAYTAVDELKVNGALTLGENVADLGGLKLAYLAMEAWLAREPTLAKEVGQYRFNAGQQFFLGFAQSWCSEYRNEMARQRALTDPHSPPHLRVNGPLSNLRSFQEAFQCKEGQAMVRPAAQRCEVW